MAREVLTRWCNKCKRNKPDCEFGIYRRAPSGRQPHCKLCNAKKNRIYRAKGLYGLVTL